MLRESSGESRITEEKPERPSDQPEPLRILCRRRVVSFPGKPARARTNLTLKRPAKRPMNPPPGPEGAAPRQPPTTAMPAARPAHVPSRPEVDDSRFGTAPTHRS